MLSLILVISGLFAISNSQAPYSYVDFDGVDNYISWPDDPNWGKLGDLSDQDYSFGFRFEEDWQGGSFTDLSMFSRDATNGIALYDATSVVAVGVSWIGSGTGGTFSGTAGVINDFNFVTGDAVQFNFDAASYTVSVFRNGILMGSVSMTSWRTEGKDTGVVRFGFPAISSSHLHYEGKVSNLWFANGHRFPDAA